MGSEEVGSKEMGPKEMGSKEIDYEHPAVGVQRSAFSQENRVCKYSP